MPNVSSTIQQFRQDVLARGGPQISGMYEVGLNAPGVGYITCYPLSIVIPGRQFVYYEHDLWGPNRKIPYKRGYTQCHMSFVVYQDWAERVYIEKWMNSIIKHTNSSGIKSNDQKSAFDQTDPSNSKDSTAILDSISENFVNGALYGKENYQTGSYDDYIQYSENTGEVNIYCLNSKSKNNSNAMIFLKEAFPAAISQMSVGSDGSSYPTFNVTFQFNDYYFGGAG